MVDVPDDYRTTVAERTRWARNAFRSDLRAFWEGWILRHPYLAIMLLDRMISPFALLVALAYGIAALVTGQWLWPSSWACGGS